MKRFAIAFTRGVFKTRQLIFSNFIAFVMLVIPTGVYATLISVQFDANNDAVFDPITYPTNPPISVPEITASGPTKPSTLRAFIIPTGLPSPSVGDFNISDISNQDPLNRAQVVAQQNGTTETLKFTGALITNNGDSGNLNITMQAVFGTVNSDTTLFWGAKLSGFFTRPPGGLTSASGDFVFAVPIGGFSSSSNSLDQNIGTKIGGNMTCEVGSSVNPCLPLNFFGRPNPADQTIDFSCASAFSTNCSSNPSIYMRGDLRINLAGDDQITLPGSFCIVASSTAAERDQALANDCDLGIDGDGQVGVPEPPSSLLLAFGLAAAIVFRKRVASAGNRA